VGRLSRIESTIEASVNSGRFIVYTVLLSYSRVNISNSKFIGKMNSYKDVSARSKIQLVTTPAI